MYEMRVLKHRRLSHDTLFRYAAKLLWLPTMVLKLKRRVCFCFNML